MPEDDEETMNFCAEVPVKLVEDARPAWQGRGESKVKWLREKLEEEVERLEGEDLNPQRKLIARITALEERIERAMGHGASIDPEHPRVEELAELREEAPEEAFEWLKSRNPELAEKHSDAHEGGG